MHLACQGVVAVCFSILSYASLNHSEQRKDGTTYIPVLFSSTEITFVFILFALNHPHFTFPRPALPFFEKVESNALKSTNSPV